jgi:hypothetical protein
MSRIKMDKHQRRQLARWETKKAKNQFKFEERLRDYWNEPVLDKIDAYGNSYKPHPVRALQGITKQAEKSLERLRELPLTWSLIIAGDFDWTPTTMFSSRVRFFGRPISEYEPFIVCDERSLEWRIDVPKTLAAIRDHKDNRFRSECRWGMVRSALRLGPLREELTFVTRKFRAIQNCRLIKEELMMNVWHPRRMEKFLETYGEDAFDNFIGL